MTDDHWVFRLRGLVYAAGFIFLCGWLALASRRYDDALGGELLAFVVPIGVVLMVLGGLLAGSCIALFIGPGRGTPAPFDPPRAFVASGPYRWFRNPMYVGGLSVLLGLGFYLRSPAIAVLSVFFAIVAHLLVVFYEEPTLRRTFGESYAAYLKQVNRWLPALPQRGRLGH